MFCQNCGVPTEGEQTLCNECAAKKSAPVQEASPADTFTLSTADDAVAAPKAPKKKGGLIAAIIALVAVAGIAVAVFLGWNSIKGFYGRTFQAPEDYFADVESQAISKYSADFVEVYGKTLSTYDASQSGAKAKLQLTLGDSILALAETTLQQQGMDMDLGWLNKISLSMDTNLQDDAARTILALGLGNEDLLSGDVIVDMEDGKVYMTIPELNKDYISGDMDTTAMSNAFAESKKMMDDLVKDLPSEDEMQELIDTYVDIALSCIDDVEKETDTISVGDASQKMVILTAKIKEKDLLNMAEKMLKEAKKDKTLKKAINAFGDYANAVNSMQGYSYEMDLYEEFESSIPSLLDQIDAAKGDISGNNYLKLEIYVDTQNNVRGHELSVYSDGEQSGETISWLTAAKGGTVYTEAKLGEVQIEGEKTEKRGVSEGFYTLTVDEQELGTLKFEDVTENSGTLKLVPSEEIMNSALSGSNIPTSLLGGNIALKLTYSENACSATVLVGSNTLVALDITAETYDGGKISTPSNSVDAEYITQWLADADFDTVLDNLDRANVPAALIELAKSYITMLQSNLY